MIWWNLSGQWVPVIYTDMTQCDIQTQVQRCALWKRGRYRKSFHFRLLCWLTWHDMVLCVPGRPTGVGGEGTRNADGQLMWTDPMQHRVAYSSNGWTADELNNLSDRRDNNIIVHSRPQLEVVALRPVVLWSGCGWGWCATWQGFMIYLTQRVHMKMMMMMMSSITRQYSVLQTSWNVYLCSLLGLDSSTEYNTTLSLSLLRRRITGMQTSNVSLCIHN